MPFTFSHPAAVLPACKLRWLDFTALIMGSIAPDLSYFIPRLDLGGFSHTFSGSILLDIPSGLLLLGLFYCFRLPVCHLLPSPHRDALLPLARGFPVWNMRGILRICLSLYIGILTHIAWDGFTHETGFFVGHFAILQETAIVIRGIDVPIYRVLQHISTAIGLAAVTAAYFIWLAKTLRDLAPAASRENDAWRYAVWMILFSVPVIPAISYALWHSNFLPFAHAVRVFIYHFVVGYIGVFFPFLGVTALLFFRLGRKRFAPLSAVRT